MLIIYDTLTGNTKRFVNKLNLNSLKISDNLLVNEDFILVTYTIRFGDIPNSTFDFLLKNSNHLKGVASSGNRNWGNNFGAAADKIAILYDVPVIHKFELSGNDKDVKTFKKRSIEYGLY